MGKEKDFTVITKVKERGPRGDGKGRGQHLQCTRCGKRGHAPANCWTLHPDQMPWKKTSYIEEEDVAVGGIGFDVGFVDVATSPPGICKRESQVGSTWTVPLSNRFEVLSEDVEIGAVEVGMNLKEAGRGRITIDSGAAESVLPKNMLPNEPIVEGEAKRRRCEVRRGQRREDGEHWREEGEVQESRLECSELHHLSGHGREQAVGFG